MDTQRVFRFEKCHAARAVLPIPTADQGLAMWLCAPPDEPEPEARRFAVGRLYLIEDFHGADLPGPSHVARSGYSALRMLLDYDFDIGAAATKTRLRYPDHAEAFAMNPAELVRELDGRVGPTRHIRVLYRIRDTLNEPAADHSVVSIGYPIVITD